MIEILLTLAVIASTTFTIILLLLPSRYVKDSPSREFEKTGAKISVQVLVLGDIGRSPRMQYHAMSIAKHGGRVEIIGYQESTLHPGLINNPLITIIPLPPPPAILRISLLPFVVVGPLKVLWQVSTLFYALGYYAKPSRWLLVQNPPSIPTLLVGLIICFLRNTHLIIDWHNYGWTILAGTRGKDHPFVKVSKLYEIILGSRAPTVSFTVTRAMAKQLRNKPYNIKSPILTLHDRPAAIFQPILNPEERQKFLQDLVETSRYAASIMAGATKLLVSSTSWTPDEDFSLLLKSLCAYASRATTQQLPPILAIITGKGPQKQMYLDRIKALTKSSKLHNVSITTAWLSAKDYATLLACADLGVCLHKSSSGVDLPMKVVDMFGAGLPVVGYGDYESWEELVQEGVNGRGFVNSEDLSAILQGLFGETNGAQLAHLRKGAVEEGKRRWDEEWDSVAGRLLGLCE